MQIQGNKPTVRIDASAQFTDIDGSQWIVGAEFQEHQGRRQIAAIAVRPIDESKPVTRRVLRDLPLGDLFRSAIAISDWTVTPGPALRGNSPTHRGRAHSDDDLQAVATAYMAAFRAHLPVQKAVADELGVSVSTAAKRIMAARRRGFLPLLTGAES